MRLDELNRLPAADAERELLRCCGSPRWAAAVAARRPFWSRDALYESAMEEWLNLDPAGWREAFAHHPRIGERAAGWAAQEQAGMREAADAVARRLTDLQAEYERKFGHVFLICATGKRADEMLAQLERRMENDAAQELKVAAAEQLKITRLRLEKLLSPTTEPSRAG